MVCCIACDILIEFHTSRLRQELKRVAVLGMGGKKSDGEAEQLILRAGAEEFQCVFFIALGEAHSLASQAAEVWGLYLWIACDAQGVVAPVVGIEHENIERFGSGRRSGRLARDHTGHQGGEQRVHCFIFLTITVQVVVD